MNRNCKIIILILCMFMVIGIIDSINVEAASGNETKGEVLILQSFQKGDEWEEGVLNGIKSVFDKDSIDIQAEYMDTQKYFQDEYYEKLFEFYSYKYQNSKFSSIVTCDNNAFNFMIKYGERLFPGIPVVFCGVNDLDASMIKNKPLYTGITVDKTTDIKDNFSIALKLRQKTKDIVVIVDNSSVGDEIKNIINEELKDNYQGHPIVFIEENNIDDLLAKINKLPPDSIVFFCANIKDKNGKYIQPAKTVQMISRQSSVPVYSNWDFLLNNNIIGGKLLSGKEYGKNVAGVVKRVLNGEKASNMTINMNKNNKYVFDYDMLKKYNINNSLLPPDSVILNKPSSQFSVSKRYGMMFLFIIIGGLILIIVILLLNIRRRKKAESALRESEERLRTLLNATPDIICFKNSNGQWEEANESAIKAFDLSGVNYKGKTNNELALLTEKCKDALVRCHKSDEIAWKEGRDTISRFEEIIPFSSGENGIYDMVKVPIFNEDGSHKALAVIGRDITEKRKTEELKLKSEEDRKLLSETMEYDKIKTEFFANISHELRTPLNVMFSTVQLFDLYLKNEMIIDKGANVHKKAYILKQNCFRLLRLVNNLIDITKIDSGYYEIQPQNYNIVNVVEDITLSVAEYIENKGISLIFDTEVEEKIMAVDAEKIERIMLNLLSNAIKFTPKGKEIIVNIYDKVNFIEISVRDTGIGIPKEKQNIIFERFRQVDKSLTRNREGSGIGLSLVKSLVEMHGGTITVNSNPGEGSEFVISIPVKVLKNGTIKKYDYNLNDEYIEKISLEFSDIYS